MGIEYDVNINELVGKTFWSIDHEVDRESDELAFRENKVTGYWMHHGQCCCEGVWLEDVAGDLRDLIGKPILTAEVITEGDDEQLWTFYKFSTIKGSVTLRWCGEGNGYYSLEVSLDRFWED